MDFEALKKKYIKHLRATREKINIFIYDSKDIVNKVLNTTSIIAALLGIATLIFDHGYENTPSHDLFIHIIFRIILGFYYFKFIVGYIYSFTPRKYFKENRVAGALLVIILCMLIYDATSPVWVTSIFTSVLGVENPHIFSVIVEQFSFLLLLVIELGRASSMLPSMNMSAPKLFVMSFVILISIGSGLLMLPRMSVDGVELSFIDALFTATSASCVTGLSTVDIAEIFTIRGQIIIMLLIQLGGLNIITFASFFLILSKKSIGIRSHALIKDSLETSNFTDSMSLLREIFISTFTIEIIGAVLIFFNWSHDTPFIDFYQKAYYSIFHAISAFNNAGFSLFTGGLTNHYCSDAYVLQFVICILALLGGIGFPVIRDIFGDIMFRHKRKINRKWSLNTKICIYTTLILIGVGMMFFTMFEWNNTLKDMGVGERFIMSFIQSAFSRTSGFNSMDFGVMNIPTLIIFIILMFIGASPVSTGGGIKTTTLSVLVLQAINTVKGKNRLNLSHQEIPQSVIFRSMTILLFSLCFVVAGTIILTFTQPGVDIINLVFEQVSAFATTGLSTGITPQLTTASKVVLIISMFCGRIGMLTFGYALIRSIRQEPDMLYPKASILV